MWHPVRQTILLQFALLCHSFAPPWSSTRSSSSTRPSVPPAWSCPASPRLTIDLSHPTLKLTQPMNSCKDDGGKHDPRFSELALNLHCSCDDNFAPSVDASNLFPWPSPKSKDWRCRFHRPLNASLAFSSPVLLAL